MRHSRTGIPPEWVPRAKELLAEGCTKGMVARMLGTTRGKVVYWTLDGYRERLRAAMRLYAKNRPRDQVRAAWRKREMERRRLKPRRKVDPMADFEEALRKELLTRYIKHGSVGGQLTTEVSNDH